MGQVPSTKNSYLILGAGRLAKHLSHYMNLTGQKFLSWNRSVEKPEQCLGELFQDSTHILVALSDSAIEPFIKARPFLNEKPLIHFSGAISISNVSSAHPLMTFTPELYTLETYKKIPFVTEKGKTPFSEIFPFWSNPCFEIEPQLKPLYHSLCVASGNFTSILWNEVFDRFQEQLGLPKEILHPYLLQITKNLVDNPNSALTGPLQRGDQSTINKNLQALDNFSLKPIYKSFVDFINSKKVNYERTTL